MLEVSSLKSLVPSSDLDHLKSFTSKDSQGGSAFSDIFKYKHKNSLLCKQTHFLLLS